MAVTERKPGGALLVEGRRRYSVPREFDIDATSRFHALSELENEMGVTYGAIFEDHDGTTPLQWLRCVSIEITARTPPPGGSGVALYYAVAQYKLQTINISISIGGEPDGAAAWRCEGALQEVPADVDMEGEPIVNSAGVPFDTPLRMLRANLVVVATWIRTGMSFSAALSLARVYRGKVNSSDWMGADPREVLCRDVLPTLIQKNMVQFEARFEYRDSYAVHGVTVAGWDEATIDRGLSTWEKRAGDADKKLYAITHTVGDNGAEQPVTQPVLLDGAGKVLGEGLDPKVLKFSILPEADFNGMGIS